MPEETPPTLSRLLDEALAAAERGEQKQAEQALKQAAESGPFDAKGFYDLGFAFHKLGLKSEAEAALKASLEKIPNPFAYGQLASLYEKANDLNNAWATATMGLRMFPDDSLLILTLARCERRAGKVKQAEARLEQAVKTVTDTTHKAQMLFQLGWLYDKQDQTEKAFAAYGEGKRLAADVARDSSADPAFTLSTIRKMKELDMGALPRFPAHKGGRGRPRGVAFLVGFPRSGTTLLNQILDSHPRLVAIEEKPLLARAAALFGKWGRPYPESLPSLGKDKVSELREAYFRGVAEFAEPGEDHVLVDKLPLNLIQLPLILTLFPEAKIILALRHPFGTVLSCFMHNFRVNNAMAHMFALESITGLYAGVMGLWRHMAAKRAFPYHPVRYEDVVNGLEGEARKLCEFLGVEWSPEMLKYDQHARAKGLINTPSYHQVVQPLYADSTERWRRYEKHLAQYRERLEPFCEAFGYEL